MHRSTKATLILASFYTMFIVSYKGMMSSIELISINKDFWQLEVVLSLQIAITYSISQLFSQLQMKFLKKPKHAIVTGIWFYSIFYLAVMQIAYCKDSGKIDQIAFCNTKFVFSTTIIGALFIGFIGRVLIWTGIFRYLSQARIGHRAFILNTFFSVIELQHVFESVFKYFFFDFGEHYIVFVIIFCLISWVSTLGMMYFLPASMPVDIEDLQIDRGSSSFILTQEDNIYIDQQFSIQRIWGEVKATFSKRQYMLFLVLSAIYGVNHTVNDAFIGKMTKYSIAGSEIEEEKKMSIVMIIYGIAGCVLGHLFHLLGDKVKLHQLAKCFSGVFLVSLGAFVVVYLTKLYGLNFFAAAVSAFLEVRFSALFYMILSQHYRSSFTSYNIAESLRSFVTSFFMIFMLPGVASLKTILYLIIGVTLALYVVLLFFYKGEARREEKSIDEGRISMPNYINKDELSDSGEFNPESTFDYLAENENNNDVDVDEDMSPGKQQIQRPLFG